MSQRYEAKMAIEYKDKSNNDKTYWLRIGTGFAHRAADGGIRITLNAMPAPQDGTYSFDIWPAEERQQSQQSRQGYQGGNPNMSQGWSNQHSQQPQQAPQGGPDDDLPPGWRR